MLDVLRRALGLFLMGLMALVLGVTQPALAQEKKPNIVIIWGDDIGQSNLSIYTKGCGLQTKGNTSCT